MIALNAAALTTAGFAGRITLLSRTGRAFPELLEGRWLPVVSPNTVPQLEIA